MISLLVAYHSSYIKCPKVTCHGACLRLRVRHKCSCNSNCWLPDYNGYRDRKWSCQPFYAAGMNVMYFVTLTLTIDLSMVKQNSYTSTFQPKFGPRKC